MHVQQLTKGAAVLAACLLAACGSAPVKKEATTVPVQTTCFSLAAPLEATEVRGLFNVVWNTRLERGAYVSVHETVQGTYFLGPPGAVRVFRPEMVDKPAGVGTHQTAEGGVFIPRDGSQPMVYSYISTESVPSVVPPEGANCATAVLVRDPVSKGVSVGAYALGGGLGGATGGLAARAAAPHSSMSYGQSIGVGAAGGAIGMAVVAALINMDIGKIQPHGLHADASFNVKLADAVRGVAPIKVD